MFSNNLKMYGIIASIILLLLSFTVFAMMKEGETLRVMGGQVQRCESLGGGKMESIQHATIRAEDGSYVIASLKNCRADAEVSILIKRGILYFNTVFAAEGTQ